MTGQVLLGESKRPAPRYHARLLHGLDRPQQTTVGGSTYHARLLEGVVPLTPDCWRARYHARLLDELDRQRQTVGGGSNYNTRQLEGPSLPRQTAGGGISIRDRHM